MNARDAIAQALYDSKMGGSSGLEDMLAVICEADALIATNALTDAGFVVVACPPGSRVVVDRTPKPCETCEGKGWEGPSIKGAVMSRDTVRCRPCRGSGVVEATTTTAVEPGRGEMVWQSIGGAEAPRWAKTWRAVALPEETPQ